MRRFPFRPILGGALIGAALFFAPFFLLRAALFILLVGAAFRVFGRRRHRHWRRSGWGDGGYWQDGRITPLRGAPTHDVAID